MELIVRPRLTVCFESEQVEQDFIKEYGEKWKDVIKRNFYRQPEGVWELFHLKDHQGSDRLGSIILDDIGFLVKPKSGPCRKRYLEEMRSSFMRQVSWKLESIFGKDGNDGSFKSYRWLLKTYGVTEEEDNSWIDLVYYFKGILEETDSFDALEQDHKKQILDFVRDDEATVSFLIMLLDKYESSNKKYPASRMG